MALYLVGLIIEDGHHPPYSSAFLIDGEGERLFGYKIGDDGTGNYTSYPTVDADIDNPISYGGVSVAALIGMDVLELDGGPAGERPRLLFECMDQSACHRKVVCVPASVGQRYFGGGTEGETIFHHANWKGRRYVVANCTEGKGNDCKSFITDRNAVISHSFPDWHNEAELNRIRLVGAPS